MRWIDNWIIARVKALLEFLFDWFGIRQKTVERFLIVVFGLSTYVRVIAIFLHLPSVTKDFQLSFRREAIMGTVVTFGLYRWHRAPQAVRAVRESSFFSMAVRLLAAATASLVAPVAVFASVLLKNNLFELTIQFSGISLALFLYVIAVNNDGERKSAKLAWSKIKELFGTAWIPIPKGTS